MYYLSQELPKLFHVEHYKINVFAQAGVEQFLYNKL